ncbi:TraB/GumN family protein [Entomomonas sp. E2T0]|uniref:TraB/GumN family protein n=1 Tax=Entomomonas sp. E2T0 TaxID=2930213 RepID=UPI0022284A2C|nr:TraB/GumN family protein [Entomomonas sp. E2T0]UYZ84518.1 TraB/GumN family protein [Entomomonas sp. E2T0]
MKKSKLWLLLIVLIAPMLAYGKSSVWIAEKDNKKIILAGSVHLIHPSQLPLPAEYLKAFDASKRIVFEIDLAEMSSLTSAAKMMQIFQLQGTTLDKTLKPAVWRELQQMMQKHNIPTTLVMFDAAFMSFSLPMIIWQQQGYQEGIDKILYDKAKQQGKAVAGLETFDQQLAALASLKRINPNILIEETLKGLTDPELALDTLIKQVYQGETTAIEDQLEHYKTKDMETFYQNLLVKRNQAWIAQITRYAADNTPTMVVVGAMHLVGDDSVLKLLEEKGYQIKYYE